LREDDMGLRIIAAVRGVDVAVGQGLSFGYRVRAARNGTFRELEHLDLIEVSLVAQPMQPLARVIAVEAGKTPSTQGETAWTMK
jgi:phage head maturation protease